MWNDFLIPKSKFQIPNCQKGVEGIDVCTCAVADIVVGACAQRYQNGSVEGVPYRADNFIGGGHGRLGYGKCAGD